MIKTSKFKTILLFGAALSMLSVFKSCSNKVPPKEISVTITVEGDTGIQVNGLKTLDFPQGTKWKEIKDHIDINYNKGLEAAGWKLDSKDGTDLKDDYAFNSNTTIYAISKAAIFKTNSEGNKIISYFCNKENLPAILIIPAAINNKTITEINIETFKDCTGIKEITFPQGLMKIAYGAFQGCTTLSAVNFSSCKNLTTLYGFDGCTALTKLDLSGCTSLKRADGFSSCSSLKEVILPESLTTIATSTFYGCTGLTNVIFPQSLTEIGLMAFDNCKSLTTIDLSDCTSLKTISGEHWYNGAFSGCTNAEIKLPENIMTISPYAFGYTDGYAYKTLCKKVLIKLGDNYERIKTLVKDSHYPEERILSY